MKAAVVTGAGIVPGYADFREPVAGAGERRIAVTAAAMSHLAKGRASGTHYSSAGTFPFVAGVDGVGRLDDGRRVYFVLPEAPFGSMAEVAAVPNDRCFPLPDGLDDATAAAIANPGLSCSAALVERAALKPGETVLVNGATGTAGGLAIRFAKHLGARRVIATGRNRAVLDALADAGADMSIPLGEDDAALDARFVEAFAAGVDVVIDYLWGDSARRLLVAAAKAMPEAVPIRFVQVGSASGGEIALPAAVLRSSAIQMMGSGLGSVPMGRLVARTRDLMEAASAGGWSVPHRMVPLAEVERAWPEDDSARRTVFTMGDQAA